MVITWSTAEQQMQRLLARGYSASDAQRRIASQLPPAEKLQHATYKIDCSLTLEDTHRQVAALIETLRHPK